MSAIGPFGPEILVATLSPVRSFGPLSRQSQYDSWSDSHSKAMSWVVLFDLLLNCPLLVQHVQAGKVGFGVNHVMNDFKARKKKALDLVVATPGPVGPRSRKTITFSDLVDKYGIVLDPAHRALLASLPVFPRLPVGSVLLAVEAKAAMTEHVKALPRLYDELNSSQTTVHGAADQALAAGFGMVNVAARFASPKRNPAGTVGVTPVYNVHQQPSAALAAIKTIEGLPRRTRPGTDGFDALGIVVVDMTNDGSPVTLVTSSPAPPPTSSYHYEQMLTRIIGAYNYRFSAL